ncbi:MAG: CHAT domain-containing protein [Aureispira sp.]|nr:CHAT domain-containing protein [Aureispira sp.]
MSLARSFMYAGGQSLLMSLWQVNDQSTARIMSHFYENLTQDMPKDKALQQAKLSYLEDVKGLGAHPGFWAAFIQLGNPESIEIDQKRSLTWLWAVLGGVVLIYIITAIVRRKRSS